MSLQIIYIYLARETAPPQKKMLKWILAAKLNTFLLKMNFLRDVMAKPSVINMSAQGVPSGKLSIVLLESTLGDTWEDLTSIL